MEKVNGCSAQQGRAERSSRNVRSAVLADTGKFNRVSEVDEGLFAVLLACTG